jgi:hypothetical protein
MLDDSPTTQLRQRRSQAQISLEDPSPRHEPLTAARGILLGVFAGGVIFALIVAAISAIWRHLG